MVGGFPNKFMIRLLNTYEWGARYSRPELKVTRAYANSWTALALMPLGWLKVFAGLIM